jgi:hypothetical protein
MFWSFVAGPAGTVDFDAIQARQPQLTLGKLTDLTASRHHVCFEAGDRVAALVVQVYVEKKI